MFNVLRPIRVSVFLSSLVLCSSFAAAQNADWHVGNDDGTKAFFMRSSFAHGYMHGYEEGFHRGDLDLQMGRAYREVKDQDKYKKICGYHAEFGDRGTFENGYRKGYVVGYTDSYAGRNFRAMQLVSQAKSDKAKTPTISSDRAYDRAFMIGYETGQKSGLQDGRSTASAAALDTIACAADSDKGASPHGDDCDAYRAGYRLGYSDGFANQRGESHAVFARK